MNIIEKIQKKKRRRKYNNMGVSPTESDYMIYKGLLIIPLRELKLYCKFLKRKQNRKAKLMIMYWKNA